MEEFLHLEGFISSPASSVESGSRGRLSKNVRLTNPADLSNHWMVFVGDGLSQRRFDEYSADLHSEQPSFCAHYEQLHVMRRALSQSVFVTGDLHGGRFHTLKPAYNLFYGVFIQPIQVGLGWKRIDAYIHLFDIAYEMSCQQEYVHASLTACTETTYRV